MPRTPGDRTDSSGLAEEIFEQLVEKKGSKLLLGHYTIREIQSALRRHSIENALAGLGFDRLQIIVDPKDPSGQGIQVYDTNPVSENLLVQMRVAAGTCRPSIEPLAPFGPLEENPVRVLKIDWLVLQNPHASFTKNQPRFPAQRHPGLGIAKKVLFLLVDLARAERLEGILVFPEHYHNAIFYKRAFFFFDPRVEGIVMAMSRDLTERSLAEQSFAVFGGCLRKEGAEEKIEWAATEMLLPISRRLIDHFASADYQRIRAQAEAENRYRIDWKDFDRRREQIIALA